MNIVDEIFGGTIPLLPPLSMAPLTRGNTYRRGSQLRNRGSGRGRGNWNSRGGRRTVQTVQSIPRQSEKVVSGKSDEIQRDEPVDISQSETSEDDQYDSLEENYTAATSGKPYNALRQSLQQESSRQASEKGQKNQPLRKKHRLSSEYKPDPVLSAPEVTAQISKLADVDEPEESESELEEADLNKAEGKPPRALSWPSLSFKLTMLSMCILQMQTWFCCKKI